LVNFLNKIKIYFKGDKKLGRSLKNMLGFYPDNIELYKQAFRHRSVCKDKKMANNERLEFLGDAIINAVIGHYLFTRFPFKDEGFLTKMRSKIVSRSRHNQVAVKLGIAAFVEVNAERGMRNSSIHGDAFEALIGAIYLDKGYQTANKFISERIIETHMDMDEIEKKETDFKSKFIEWAQKERVPFEFRMKEEVGHGPDKQFIIELFFDNEIRGLGRHFSKKRAEQMAAEEAINKITM
jgi:ribonuclease-3